MRKKEKTGAAECMAVFLMIMAGTLVCGSIRIEAEDGIMALWENESELRLWPGSEIEMEAQTEAEDQTESELQHLTEHQTEYEAQIRTECQTESEPQTAAEYQAEPEGQTEPQAQTERKQESIPEDAYTVMVNETAKEQYYEAEERGAKVRIQIEGTTVDGILYSNADAVVYLLTEADEQKEGNAAYCVIPCTEEGTWRNSPEECVWRECRNGQTIAIPDEGFFQIYIRTEDTLGNLNFVSSDLFCADRTVPRIRVEGVEDQSANNGAVNIRISCEDPNYKEGSFRVSVIGLNQGGYPVVKQRKEQADGAWVQYHDFPYQKKYDDRYQLLVSVEDLAGNRTEHTLEFSVNRFGSVWELSENTKMQLEGYYLSEAVDIVLNEINIDYVRDAELFCRWDGELRMLEADTDYQVTMQGEEHAWKQYQYTIPAEYFTKDGIYELALVSTDEASNVNDAGEQGERVLFVLDRTAPGCTVSGIRSGMRFDKEKVTAFVTPHDNSGISEIRVYNNEKLIWKKMENIKTDQTFTVEIEKAEEWQRLQIFVRDFAGNEFWSEQIPVYIHPLQELNAESEQLNMQRGEVLIFAVGTVGILGTIAFILIIMRRNEG